MTSHATIGIDNDLATSQAAIAHGAANHKTTSWINVIFRFVVDHYAWHNFSNDLLDHVVADLLLCCLCSVLVAHQHRIDAYRLAITILDRHLAFAIGSQIRQRAILAQLRKATPDTV